MNNQETIDHLEGLKLKGMAQTFKASLNLPVQERPTAEQLVGKMAEAELFYRNQRRTEMYLKTSKLRYNAVMEEVICSAERNFTKDQLDNPEHMHPVQKEKESQIGSKRFDLNSHSGRYAPIFREK